MYQSQRFTILLKIIKCNKSILREHEIFKRNFKHDLCVSKEILSQHEQQIALRIILVFCNNVSFILTIWNTYRFSNNDNLNLLPLKSLKISFKQFMFTWNTFCFVITINCSMNSRFWNSQWITYISYCIFTKSPFINYSFFAINR